MNFRPVRRSTTRSEIRGLSWRWWDSDRRLSCTTPCALVGLSAASACRADGGLCASCRWIRRIRRRDQSTQAAPGPPGGSVRDSWVRRRPRSMPLRGSLPMLTPARFSPAKGPPSTATGEHNQSTHRSHGHPHLDPNATYVGRKQDADADGSKVGLKSARPTPSTSSPRPHAAERQRCCERALRMQTAAGTRPSRK